MHRFLLHNGEIRNTQEPLLSPGQVGFLNGWGVFSTLRVANGVLFAYERHYERMRRDAVRLRVPFELSAPGLHASLLRLIDANSAFEATLRVSIVRNKGGLFESPGLTRDSDIVAFTADLRVWGSGVNLSYISNGRYGASPFAGAKVTSWAQNLTWYEEAHERGFDEVILLNENGQVSECTSANIFAIQKDRIVTPPLSTSGCLPGVTRALLLEEITVPGLEISERELTPSELEESDQVFITSTTRDLLPVLEIDGAPLHQDRDGLHSLQDAFAGYRAAYISAYTGAHARQENRIPL
ncbi:MAG: aminotransferase class IV [Acidobacteriota bacterium]|nr:aminotransferase class IV [Acidobacteriota bacterium]